MAPIRIGFVGLSSNGWASTALAPPLLQKPLSEEYTITALSTTSSLSSTNAAEIYTKLTSHDVKPYHGRTDEIASDADVDFVVISVKTPDHKAAVLPAIEKGKDVFLEWPLGNGLQESLEIAEAARRKGVRTMIGLQSWQSPVVRKLKEWVSSGKIGRVLSATWVGSKPSEIPYWAPVAQRRDAYSIDPKNGATFLHIIIGHNISAITSVLGPLASIFSTTAQLFEETQIFDGDRPTGETVKTQSPDQFAFSGVLRDSGAILNASWRSGISCTKETDKNRATLIWIIDGEDGHIRVESTHLSGGAIHVSPPLKVYLNGEEVSVFEGEDKLGNTGRAWQEFAKGPEKGFYPTFDDAVVNYKYVDAIARSAKEGRRVDVDI